MIRRDNMDLTMEDRLAAIYSAHAVSRDYEGPLANDFHALMWKKFCGGMQGGRTSQTLLQPGETPEQREAALVKDALAVEWAKENGCIAWTYHFLPDLEWHDFRWSVIKDRVRLLKAKFWSAVLTNPYRTEQS